MNAQVQNLPIDAGVKPVKTPRSAKPEQLEAINASKLASKAKKDLFNKTQQDAMVIAREAARERVEDIEASFETEKRLKNTVITLHQHAKAFVRYSLTSGKPIQQKGASVLIFQPENGKQYVIAAFCNVEDQFALFQGRLTVYEKAYSQIALNIQAGVELFTGFTEYDLLDKANKLSQTTGHPVNVEVLVFRQYLKDITSSVKKQTEQAQTVFIRRFDELKSIELAKEKVFQQVKAMMLAAPNPTKEFTAHVSQMTVNDVQIGHQFIHLRSWYDQLVTQSFLRHPDCNERGLDEKDGFTIFYVKIKTGGKDDDAGAIFGSIVRAGTKTNFSRESGRKYALIQALDKAWNMSFMYEGFSDNEATYQAIVKHLVDVLQLPLNTDFEVWNALRLQPANPNVAVEPVSANT